VPKLDSLNLPVQTIKQIASFPRGLVLVTGPTGCGKTTTLASMLNHINHTFRYNIMTIEDPVEYTHTNIQSIINQREVGTDTKSFNDALRHVLRQDPDVILIGEMRDLETVSIAITAAETGHLVFATLHTNDAVSSINRMIDVFPETQQRQIRLQLSTTLQAVISQLLLPVVQEDTHQVVPAVEIMISNPAIRNLIRESKTYQIASAIQSGAKTGMQTMNRSLVNLYMDNKISLDECMAHATDADEMKSLLRV
jgi:twitching motility protein PilT